MLLSLFYFSLVWLAAIYLFNCALVRKFKVIHIETALLYISSVMLLGVFGEVLIDSLYKAVFKIPLWEYHLLPIHNAFTSYYSLFIWGMYGFHLYLLHHSLNGRIRTGWGLAAIVTAEAIVLEVLFNLTSLAVFHQYIFYYLPNDLWHITSVQVMPVYFLAGFLVVRLTRSAKVDPWFFTLTNAVLVFVLVFLTS
ncbi:MAG: hypothetical protein JWM46_671 [Candidatus Kaiserbacteria bacterium]|nr:hypothetical protein [Candidatus Kaiserbacteria bacterium]